MKKIILIMASVVALSATAYAQKGTTQIGVAAEIGIPTGDFGGSEDDGGFKTGFGGSVKGLFGVGTAGQITFTTGYTSFTAKGSTSDEKFRLGVIPFLIGYRQNFNGFYVEPQAGMGVYSAKIKFMGESETESKTKFTWAAGVGYAKNGLDIGIRYQSGEFEDDFSVSLVGVHIGYNFSLGGGSAK